MAIDGLGRWYEDGECVVRQGEQGSCMFVVQEGELEVFHESEGRNTRVGVLGAGEIFGEMALFERNTRSATVRAKGRALVLTVDRRTLLRRIKEDPLIALNLMETLCHRIRRMGGEMAELRAAVVEEIAEAEQ